MNNTKVSDLTVDELKSVIRETVTQLLAELLADPDKGLQLNESFTDELLAALKEPKANYTTAENLANKLDLEW